MEKRRFGRTEHMSTVAILGAFSFGHLTQEEADEKFEEVVLTSGINHIDVAPTYGEAELRLGPWMERVRDRFFVGCKTQERDKQDAADELRRSLERLRIDRFDLHQLHAVTSMEELDQVTSSGGALEALIEARDEGLTDYIGITGHGMDCPRVFQEALRRFDFDSVLFPINFVLYANPTYRRETEVLLRMCRERDVGVMVIKAVAKGRWGDRPREYTTWYEPFDQLDTIQPAVNFALSKDVTGLCTAGDPTILPLFIEACENFTPMDESAQEKLIAKAHKYEVIFE